jgi:hypothetical protein
LPALDVVPASGAAVGATCAICQCLIEDAEAVGPCPACTSPFHEECWAENGGCATYGCAHMPETVVEAPEVHVGTGSWWGQDHKQCPRCNTEIRAAAVRCRACGARFTTANPDKLRLTAASGGRTSRKGLVPVLFIASVFPCTAPMALLAGALWIAVDKQGWRDIGTPYRAVVIVGMVVSLTSTVLLVGSLIMHVVGSN